MLKTYVSVISSRHTRDWVGMMPFVPVGTIFHREGLKLVAVEAHIMLTDGELSEDGVAVQHVTLTQPC